MTTNQLSLELTSQNFKSDNVAGAYSLEANNDVSKAKPQRKRDSDKERKHRPRHNAAETGGDYDDEIRKAIELSKRTAVIEEASRIKEVEAKSKKQAEPDKAGGEFDFKGGFEKFATGAPHSK